MFVLDNFYPKNLIDPVIHESYEQKWTFSRVDSNQDRYWTTYIFGDSYSRTHSKSVFLKEFISQDAEKCWEFFRVKADCGLTNDNLDSVYFNGLTHGLEAHAHIDAQKENFVTVITYVCESWNSHWGGETIFFDGEYSNNPADDIFYTHNIVKSVIPRYNRVVLFSGNIVHAVRPLSKSFKDLRVTMMFKIKDKKIEDFNKLWQH